MTTRLDHACIQIEVRKFYRYVMLSHRWQPNEPTFQMVDNISIYGLPESPANRKLLTFCELMSSLCFRWAWSDTCCVNQLDKGVQQESLVAMFRWYRGASLTVVHLLGVLSESQELGCLWRSTWNIEGGHTKNTLLPRLSNSTPETGSHILAWAPSTTRNHL